MDSNDMSFTSRFSLARQIYRMNRRKILLLGAILALWCLLLASVKYLNFSYLVTNLLGVILYPPLWVGFCFWFLKLVRGEKARTKDFLAGFRYFLCVCVASLLLHLIVFTGTILLIIPGAIWFLKYGFAPVIAIDKKAGPFKSLKISSKITQGHKNEMVSILFFFIAAMAMQFPFQSGFINVGYWWAPWLMAIGLPIYLLSALVVFPFTVCIWMSTYNSLSSQKNSQSENSKINLDADTLSGSIKI